MVDFEDKEEIIYQVADSSGEYKAYKDFTTLECWKSSQKVKMFF